MIIPVFGLSLQVFVEPVFELHFRQFVDDRFGVGEFVVH